MSLEGSYKLLGAADLNRIERYVRLIEKLMSNATGRFISLSSELDYDSSSGDQFYFADYPEVAKKVEKIVANLAQGMETAIITGTNAEWTKGTQDANGILDYVLKKVGLRSSDSLDSDVLGKYLNNHDSALKAFQKRQIGGMNLSNKVWNLANQSKIESELARSIAQGTSAQKVAESMQEYLKKPNELYRRVKDEFGTLRLSRRAKAYHPEEGAYRSSYKNAMRLARTEINMSYRNAEQESYQDKDYVVGIEIRRSQIEYDCDLCASLAGKYPKDFKWNGWHPNCRCYMVPILLTDEEMRARSDAIINGEEFDASGTSNVVKDVPDNFKEWVTENSDRIGDAADRGTLPYFVQDNREYVGASMYSDSDELSLTQIRDIIKVSPETITESIFQDEGIYAESRKELHKKIIEEYIGSNSSTSDTVFMLGGAPANGKSTLVDSGMLKHPTGSLVIDADKVKSMIPEYAKMIASGDKELIAKAANFVHEESSMLGKAIQEKAFKQGLSVVIDGVNDGSFEKVQKNVAKIKAMTGGKRVRADYVTLDTDLSLKLAKARAAKTGRMVPESVILNGNKGIAEIVPKLVRNNTFDELYLWDTNINGTPRLILKQVDGKLEVLDQKLYESFLKKAGNNTEALKSAIDNIALKDRTTGIRIPKTFAYAEDFGVSAKELESVLLGEKVPTLQQVDEVLESMSDKIFKRQEALSKLQNELSALERDAEKSLKGIAGKEKLLQRIKTFKETDLSPKASLGRIFDTKAEEEARKALEEIRNEAATLAKNKPTVFVKTKATGTSFAKTRPVGMSDKDYCKSVHETAGRVYVDPSKVSGLKDFEKAYAKGDYKDALTHLSNLKAEVVRQLELENKVEVLSRIPQSMFDKVPKDWKPSLNAAIETINKNKARLVTIQSDIEYAYNVYKLSSSKMARQIGLNNISPMMPNEILTEFYKYKIYLKNSDSLGNPIYSTLKQFFNTFDKFTPMELRGKSELMYYSPQYKMVCLNFRYKEKGVFAHVERLIQSDHKYSIIFHEYGHAYDDIKGLRRDKDFENLFDNWFNFFNSKPEVFQDYSDELRRYATNGGKALTTHQIEFISSASDTIQSLDQDARMIFGGHDPNYFKRDMGSRKAEFIAHMMENYWLGNPAFKKVLEDLFDEMIDFLSNYYMLN